MKQNLVFFMIYSVALFFAGMWFESYDSDRDFRTSLYTTCIKGIHIEVFGTTVLATDRTPDQMLRTIVGCRRFVEESVEAMKDEPLPQGVYPIPAWLNPPASTPD